LRQNSTILILVKRVISLVYDFIVGLHFDYFIVDYST
jgi:hypothetical protein